MAFNRGRAAWKIPGIVLLILASAAAWRFHAVESPDDPDAQYQSLLASAMRGDPVSIYSVGVRQKTLSEEYAWYMVCKKRIQALPGEHSIPINRTEFEIDTAIRFFDERLSAQEKNDAMVLRSKLEKTIPYQ